MRLFPNLALLLLRSAIRAQGTRALSHNSGRTFQLTDAMTDHSESRNYKLLWYDEVTSTMDKTKELISTHKDNFFAVAAGAQSNGRGTRGRDWISAKNNLLITVAIKRALIPIPITLLPLRIGTILASSMAKRVTTQGSTVTLKWPNDVLINSRKACGVLIEMEGDMLLVGIGCNVLSAPTVNANTNNANAAPTIRPATCLADHNRVYAQLVESMQQQTQECAASSSGAIDGQRIELTMRVGDVHKELGLDICDHLYDWLASQTDTAALVVQDFERNMDLSPQRLRDIADPALSTVIPTALNIDGTLKVKYAHNNEEGVLVAEYLW